MKMSTKTRLLLSAVTGASIAATAAPTFAQDADDDTVIVTGTRIKQQANLVSSSPVTTVDGDSFAVRGTVNVEDLVNELPQVFAGQSANIGNGATGTATVNLRGLGASRTLVMIDGKRMGPGSTQAVPSDLNQIPSSLIKNIDISTGGAGAVYGSDALAGVVNIEMNREFQGVRLDMNIGAYQHKNDRDDIQDLLERSGNLNSKATSSQLDGASKNITLSFGTDFAEGKGNVTGYVGYNTSKELTQANRDYSACAFGGGTSNTTADPGVRCVGSFTTPNGTFTDPTFSRYFFTLDEDNPTEFRDLDFANDTFNFNPTNHFQRPQERWNAGFFANYDLTDKDTLYTDVMYMDDRSVAQIAFSGNFGVTTEISCDNPFLSTAQQGVICDPTNFTATELERFNDDNVAPFLLLRRNFEGDPRQDDLRHTSFRGVAGIKGDFRLLDGFEYDVSASLSSVHFAENYLNEISVSRAQNALYATSDADGNPVCRTDLVNDPTCVPINWFQIGGVTEDALDYVQGSGFQDGNVEQTIVQAVVTGSLDDFKLPTATNGLGLAVGVEYRLDDYELRTDNAFTTGDLAGQGGPSIGLAGSFDSYEAFGEVQLPLVEDKPGFEELTFNGAYRYADNSLSGGASSYSAGLVWQPIDAIRLRGQYQRAVRAANAVELFRATSIGLFNLNEDPCSGTTPSATAAECANSGVTAAQYGNITANPAGQYNQLLGGNTNLNPEKSDTYTLGAVLQPIDGLNLTVDYFDIKVNDFIGTVLPGEALNNCVDSGDEFFCSLVNRDPASGSLWLNSNGFVTATNVNTGSLSTSGIDVNADYTVGLGDKGDLALGFTGTYLLDLVTESLPGSTPFDCAGSYGDDCGSPNPEWRHFANATWMSPYDLDLNLTWRYFQAVTAYAGLDGTGGVGAAENSFDEKLGEQNYFDLAATYHGIEDVTLRFGVNNVFDRDPPLSSSVGAGFGNGNTYPSTYDALGRYLFARATIDF